MIADNLLAVLYVKLAGFCHTMKKQTLNDWSRGKQ